MKISVDNEITESRYEVPTVELWYPRVDGNAKELEIGLCDVRAADSIRISYDFERDGYAIRQSDCKLDDHGEAKWIEVAFVQSWALEEPDSESTADVLDGLRQAREAALRRAMEESSGEG